MEGYWKDAKRTDEVMETHPDEPEIMWMRTGDIGIMDEEGYVRIVGRSKDVIIRGGKSGSEQNNGKLSHMLTLLFSPLPSLTLLCRNEGENLFPPNIEK